MSVLIHFIIKIMLYKTKLEPSLFVRRREEINLQNRVWVSAKAELLPCMAFRLC